jgi:hypothetical protein
MTQKPITLKFIVPTVLALALGISIATPDAPGTPTRSGNRCAQGRWHMGGTLY